jgi:hypothetical protein
LHPPNAVPGTSFKIADNTNGNTVYKQCNGIVAEKRAYRKVGGSPGTHPLS